MNTNQVVRSQKSEVRSQESGVRIDMLIGWTKSRWMLIVLVVVLVLVIEGVEVEDRFAEDEDDYDMAAFTNDSIFSGSRTLNLWRVYGL